MEITNLDNPIDDELMAELRDLALQTDGLLSSAHELRFSWVPESDLIESDNNGLTVRTSLIDELAGYLN